MLLIFDKKKVHPLFNIAVAKSNNLKRRISCFRTKQGMRIDIYIYPKKFIECVSPKEAAVSIAIIVPSNNSCARLEETYYLESDGSGWLRISAEVRSGTGRAIHSFKGDEKWTAEEVVGENSREWIRRQLDTLADWLGDSKTARVNPYHPDRILTEEEGEVDRFLANCFNITEDFKRKLHNTPLTPGIHIIE